jgi:hypothetical protein
MFAREKGYDGTHRYCSRERLMGSRSSASALVLLLLVGSLMVLNVPSSAAEGSVVDVAVTSLVPNKRVVGEYRPMRLNVTLCNEGDEGVTVDAAIYLNATRVADVSNLTMANGESLTVPLTWEARIGKGNYTLWANVTVLLGETDLDNNICAGGWLFVTLIGDVNGDRRKDIFDVVRAAMAYGASNPWHPRYDPYCDMDEDGVINIFDLVMIIDPYGISW